MLSKIKASILILIILLAAALWAIHPSKPQMAMKRESRITPANLEQALDLSLAYGYRAVKWQAVGMEG